MKPTLETFKKAVEKYGGNLTSVAKAFGVARGTVGTWRREDPEFHAVVQDARMNLFDECLTTARVTARGIPIVGGNEKGESTIIGWTQQPDGQMIRYLLGTLGKTEGFGESLDITTNGKDISTGIQVEIIDRRDQVENTDDTGI